MTRELALDKVIDIINTEDDISEAEEIAYNYNITLTEVWDDNDEEIIGIMADDIVIYF